MTQDEGRTEPTRTSDDATLERVLEGEAMRAFLVDEVARVRASACAGGGEQASLSVARAEHRG